MPILSMCLLSILVVDRAWLVEMPLQHTATTHQGCHLPVQHTWPRLSLATEHTQLAQAHLRRSRVVNRSWRVGARSLLLVPPMLAAAIVTHPLSCD